MKHLTKIATLLLISLFVAGSAFGALTEQTGAITVGTADATAAPGAEFSMPVTITQAGAAVGGVAFTLTYNSTVVEFVRVDDGGVSVADPTESCSGTAEGCDPYATDGDATSTLFYQANDDGAGKVMIAAASAEALPVGSTIFNVVFKFKETATEGDTAGVGIDATNLNNPSAGYENEDVDMLGAMPESDGSFANIFPASKTTPTANDVDVDPDAGCAKGDLNCDGTVNIFDVLEVIDAMGTQNPAADLNNSGGDIDIFDVLEVIDLME